jgi:hypothetical protein
MPASFPPPITGTVFVDSRQVCTFSSTSPCNTTLNSLTVSTHQLTFTCSSSPDEGDRSFTFIQSTEGVLYPKFQVQSIVYATPGNRSSNGFTTGTTHGTTTSVGQSFQQGNTTTFTTGLSFLGAGATVSWSYGFSTTSGNTQATTATITQAAGVANASNSANPNAINHSQDLFVIWLNPAVKITQTGDTSVGYGMGTQLQGTGDPNPGQPQIQDQIEIPAQAMMASASNNNLTTVPVAILTPQIVNGQTLPGLANVCANHTFYPNSCTLANQCGCVPSDFTPILSHDPLLNFSTTQSPLTANTSGASACTNPSSSASCRYVPIMVSNGSGVQVTALLQGPSNPGGNIPNNSFTQTDSTQNSTTYSESFSQTVGFAWQKQWAPGSGLSLRNATQWTWTNSESSGSINGQSNTMGVTLSSSTVGCSQQIPIFEDTVFHTFVFQQPASNSSCP